MKKVKGRLGPLPAPELSWLVELGKTPNYLRTDIDRQIPLKAKLTVAEGPAYEGKVEALFTSLEGLLRSGQASSVIEIAERFLSRLEESWHHIEDPFVILGSILDRLEELHREACEEVRPDPRALANRLAHRELASPIGVFTGAVMHYYSVLGEEGVAEYRSIVEPLWEAMPPLHAERDDGWRIQQVMESVAQAGGDVDDVARAMSRNLFLPCRYLQIAMLYRREARPVESREWAERGLALFPEDEPLKRFLGHEPERDYTPEEDLGVMVAMRAAGLIDF